MAIKRKMPSKVQAALDKPNFRTCGSSASDAELCRLNGWKVGDILQGCEFRRMEQIVITAIGEESVLARVVYPVQNAGSEELQSLTCRDWRFVGREVLKEMEKR